MNDGLIRYRKLTIVLIAVGEGEVDEEESLLHHLVRKHLSVLHRDAQGVGTSGQRTEVNTLEGVALRAHQAALKVIQLHLGGFHIGRELQVEPGLGGIGVEQVGTNDIRGLVQIPQFVLEYHHCYVIGTVPISIGANGYPAIA